VFVGRALRAFIDSFTTDVESNLKEARFHVHLLNLSIYLMQRFCVAIVILIGGLGILSRFVYSGEQFQALLYWRILICVFTSLLVISVSVFDWTRRWFSSLYLLEFVFVMILSGYFLVQLEAHRGMGMAILIVLPLWTVPMPAPLGIRLLTTGMSFLSFIGIYMVVGWEPIFLAVTALLLGGTVIVSIFLGHGVFYRLNRNNYFKDRQLKEKRQQIEYMARYDQLTGLYNRGELEERLEEAFERSHRYDRSLSMLMIDLDHFKKINDEYGHAAGDNVLETFGEQLSQRVRTPDIAGRFGGEEFCVVLPETTKADAVEVAERIKKQLAEESFESEEGEQFRVTCSIGVAERNQKMNSAEDLIRHSDEALYQAKSGGRNLVVSYSE
jgi:diguanylate cyclase (GGDEF)-like protein